MKPIIALLFLTAIGARAQWPVFRDNTNFNERAATFRLAQDVRANINSPPASAFGRGRATMLIIYTLPNGNTLEQTLGHKPLPGEDWHFDIQHIAAQTRFLRQLLPDRNIVVTCLEADATNLPHSWPSWRKQNGDAGIPDLVANVKKIFSAGGDPIETVLSGHSGGGSFIFGYLNAEEKIPDDVTRIAFLDSNYAYDPARGHDKKLEQWLAASPNHRLCVLAYDDANALLNGKPFVSARGGTWGRSHAMLDDLGKMFKFASQTNASLETFTALDGRIKFLLKENPERKIYHTVQVERNGFIEAMVSGTTNEGVGYQYFGERAYGKWIEEAGAPAAR